MSLSVGHEEWSAHAEMAEQRVDEFPRIIVEGLSHHRDIFLHELVMQHFPADATIATSIWGDKIRVLREYADHKGLSRDVVSAQALAEVYVWSIFARLSLDGYGIDEMKKYLMGNPTGSLENVSWKHIYGWVESFIAVYNPAAAPYILMGIRELDVIEGAIREDIDPQLMITLG